MIALSAQVIAMESVVLQICPNVPAGRATWAAEAKSAQPWLLEDRGRVCWRAGLEENLCQLSRDRSMSRLCWLTTASLYEAKQSHLLLLALLGSWSCR
jgi:hypothetical protein